MNVYFCSAFGVHAQIDASTSSLLQIASGTSVSEALAGRGGGAPWQTE